MTLTRQGFALAAFLALGLAQSQAQGETVIVQPANPPTQAQGGAVILEPVGRPVTPVTGGAVVLKAGDPALADGCWVEIFEDDDFDADDPHVIIKGPFEAASLKDLAGRNWNNDIESIIVGPRATVRAYEEKDFKSTEIVFAPNQRVKELSEVKMGNDIESLRILCQ